ncbi:MAG: dTMP kinase [Nitrospiraceae bacterium]|nr:dTMP kinase [Nitrospiraceae bacterium]
MSGRGLFITFEGVEGCGKSTQLERLKAHLESRGRDVVTTREPGGTPIAETLRGLLLDPANSAMAPVTELLLYEAARAQHVARLIGPALEAGQVVLCDRFADSTTAYQGAGRGLAEDTLAELHAIATQGVWPDLTLVIDLPVELGLKRARRSGEGDRIEQESIAFHERVRAGFLRQAKSDPGRVRVVDGTGSVDQVGAAIGAIVDDVLEGV